MTALIGNPLLLTSAPSGDDDAYQIEKSLRFNSADTPYLSMKQAAGNQRQWTWSGWIKKCDNVNYQSLFQGQAGSGVQAPHSMEVSIASGMYLYISLCESQGATIQWSAEGYAHYRDPSAWQHWVIMLDTPNPNPNERIRAYLNGKKIQAWGTRNTITQNFEYGINKSDAYHRIGANFSGDNPQWHLDGYLANVESIDGLCLSPAAFGSFDSTGIWNPKEFALPQPNQNQDYSDSSNWSTSAGTLSNIDEAFKGNFGLWGPSLTASTTSLVTFTPDSEIDCNVGIEVGNWGATGYIYINKGEEDEVQAVLGSSESEHCPAPTSRKIKNIAIQATSGSVSITGFKVDDVELIDGKTDETYEQSIQANTDLNDGTDWHSQVTGSEHSSRGWEKIFNGLLSDGGSSATQSTSTWTPAGGMEVTESLRLYALREHADCNITITFTDSSTFNSFDADNTTKWYSITGAAGKTISTIAFVSTNNTTIINAVEVDGVVLKDNFTGNNSVGTNSFHLKFNDTNDLGRSSLPLDVNNPDKGGPILKTTDTSSGQTLDSGTNTDSSSSTLLFAMPGNGSDGGTSFSDYYATIKGSGSNNTLTATGAVTKTDASMFYGSSTYIPSDGDGSTSSQQSKYITLGTPFKVGTSDFTVEAWVRPERDACDPWLNWRVDSSAIFTFGFKSSGESKHHSIIGSTQAVGNSTTSQTFTNGITTCDVDQWSHIAFVRKSGTIYVYKDGVKSTDTVSLAYDSLDLKYIGMTGYNSTDGEKYYGVDGHIADVRVYSSAKYDGNFIPNAPMGNFTLTNLTSSESEGMHGKAVATATGAKPVLVTTDTYGAVTDGSTRSHSTSNLLLALALNTTSNLTDDKSSSNRTMTNNGTVTATTDATAYYGGVALFNSNSQNLTTSSSNFDFGGHSNPTNFTVEMWFYTTQNKDYSALYDTRTSASDSNGYTITIDNDGEIYMYGDGGFRCRSGTGAIKENQWYHVALQRNTNTFELFLDGVLLSSVSHNMHPSNNGQYIGNNGWNNGDPFKGYIQDVRVYATRKYTGDFIVTRPKFPASDIDSFVDSPTSYGEDTGLGGEVRGNYATMNPLTNQDYGYGSWTLTQGNLHAAATNGSDNRIGATMGASSGKWYWEVEELSSNASAGLGINKEPNDYHDAWTTGDYVIYQNSGDKHINGTGSSYGNSYTAGDVIGVQWDADNGAIYFWKNGTLQNSGTAAKTGMSGIYTPCLASTSSGTSNEFSINFGQRPFKYTNAGTNRPAATYKCLCTQNLDDTFSGAALNNPSKYFSVTTWVGDGSSPRTIKQAGDFTPDLVWLKHRTNGGRSHYLYDAVRTFASQKELVPDSTVEEGSSNHQTQNHGYVSGVGAGTFTLGAGATNQDYTNKDTDPYVAWAWDIGTEANSGDSFNQGSPSITIGAGNQWVNTTAGFSITKYTGTGSAATISHGLAAKPEFVLIKNIETSSEWAVYHKSLGIGKVFLLTDDAADTDADYFPSEPTDTLFSLGTKAHISQTDDYMMYAWTSIPGYSATGKYTGTGVADGPMIHLGFNPKFILFKNDGAGTNWIIYDTERADIPGSNPNDQQLHPDGQWEEGSGKKVDFVSNGMKIVDSNAGINGAGGVYYYFAIAEHPFKTTRAR